jgi:hypothetical protein
MLDSFGRPSPVTIRFRRLFMEKLQALELI